MYKITGSLYAIVAIVASFWAMSADSLEKVLARVGIGIVFALLSLKSAVAARDED